MYLLRLLERAGAAGLAAAVDSLHMRVARLDRLDELIGNMLPGTNDSSLRCTHETLLSERHERHVENLRHRMSRSTQLPDQYFSRRSIAPQPYAFAGAAAPAYGINSLASRLFKSVGAASRTHGRAAEPACSTYGSLCRQGREQ
jgi:hypothetical protein